MKVSKGIFPFLLTQGATLKPAFVLLHIVNPHDYIQVQTFLKQFNTVHLRGLVWDLGIYCLLKTYLHRHYNKTSAIC